MSDLMLLYDYYMREAETTYFYERMRMFEQLARVLENIIYTMGVDENDE